MKKLTIVLMTIFLFTAAQTMNAQSLNAAGKAYNTGLSLTEEDKQFEAIESYQKCVEICEELGEVGEGLMVKAQTKMASMYMKLGIEAFNGKAYDTAVNYLLLSAEYSEKTGDAANVTKAKNYAATSYTSIGNSLYKGKKYKDALSSFNTALELNPNNYKAYYGQALCYKKTGNTEGLEIAINKVIELGGTNKVVEKAKDLGSKYFLSLSGQALQAESYGEASMLAKKSIEYNYLQATAYYYQATANNNLENWDVAIQAATDGLKAETEDQSNLYFELGRAYEGKGDKPKACESYGNVNGGPNVEAASYQRNTVLKCD